MHKSSNKYADGVLSDDVIKIYQIVALLSPGTCHYHDDDDDDDDDDNDE